MLAGNAECIPIKLPNGEPRYGLYEIGGSQNAKVLARLVELPLWLSELAEDRRDNPGVIGAQKSLLTFLLQANDEDLSHTTPDSKGHILLKPRSLSIDVDSPLVGLDYEIFERLIRNTEIKFVDFYVFRAGYILHEVWRVDRDTFLSESIEVQPDERFMKQMMIPIKNAKRTKNGA
jgi:hypothetical protein